MGYPFENRCRPFEGLAFFSTHERKWNLCVGYSLEFCEKILIITLANGLQLPQYMLLLIMEKISQMLKTKGGVIADSAD